jgi:hypothetical protein
MNCKKTSLLRIDPENGNIIIRQQYQIEPYEPAPEFFNSELYRRYAFGKTTLQDLQLRGGNGRILLKVPEINGYNWNFVFDFKNMRLKSVAMHVARQSLQEFAAMNKHDFLLYQGLLNGSCLEYLQSKSQEFASSVQFPWGTIKVGSYPEGLVLKLIVHYKFWGQSCVNF